MAKASEGDFIEWRGSNKIYQGKVTRMGDTLICVMENGKSFQLDDLRYSKSAKLIQNDLHRD